MYIMHVDCVVNAIFNLRKKLEARMVNEKIYWTTFCITYLSICSMVIQIFLYPIHVKPSIILDPDLYSYKVPVLYQDIYHS